MTLKLLFVGASHMAAHKLAYDAAPVADVDVVFKGLGGTEFFAIRAASDGLWVDVSKLSLPDRARPFWSPLDELVRYDEFHGFVVLPPSRSDDVLSALRALAADDPDYSRRYLTAVARQLVKNDRGLALGADLAKHTRRPVMVVAPPLPAMPPRDVLADDEAPFRQMEALYRTAAAKRGLIYVPQPSETLDAFCKTNLAFTQNSLTLGGQFHPEAELRHMNAHYGALALADVVSAAQAAAPPLPQVLQGPVAKDGSFRRLFAGLRRRRSASL